MASVLRSTRAERSRQAGRVDGRMGELCYGDQACDQVRDPRLLKVCNIYLVSLVYRHLRSSRSLSAGVERPRGADDYDGGGIGDV